VNTVIFHKITCAVDDSPRNVLTDEAWEFFFLQPCLADYDPSIFQSINVVEVSFRNVRVAERVNVFRQVVKVGYLVNRGENCQVLT
jgi:hypothetical protein